MGNEKKNAEFMYVISAVESAAGMLTAYEHYPELTYKIFESVKNQEKHINIGVLSNAFTEKHDLKGFWKMLKEEHQSDVVLQGDSGGLQVITLGKDITPELKREIYSRQSKYCNQALCFDEIPLNVLSAGGGILGTTVEYVDSLFRINAIKTGKNIAEQIEIFKNEKIKNAKILFILQGKDFKTLREWAWFAFQEVKKVKGYEDYIEGLAVGVVENLGLRGMADFMLRFQHELEFLPSEWTKKVHVLGAGTISKSLIYFIVDDEYFKPGTVISADSTSQTRAMVFGKYVYFDEEKGKLKNIDAGREYTENSKLVVGKIWNFVKNFKDIEPTFKGQDYNSFRNNYTEYNNDLKRKKCEFECYDEYKKIARVGRYFWSMAMVSDFVKYLENIKTLVKEYNEAKDNENKDPWADNKSGVIIRKLKEALPRGVFDASKLIIGLKDYGKYMEGSEDEIIKGHPYTETIDIKYLEMVDSDGILELDGRLLSTDYYNGELRVRELQSSTGNKDWISPETLRGRFLSKLQAVPINTIKHLQDKKDGNE